MDFDLGVRKVAMIGRQMIPEVFLKKKYTRGNIIPKYADQDWNSQWTVSERFLAGGRLRH